MRLLPIPLGVVLLFATGNSAAAMHVSPMDPPLAPRPMPHVLMPLAFQLPPGCEIPRGGEAVQTSVMTPGERGTLIHWVARCPRVLAADMPEYFARALDAQGWTRTRTTPPAQATYFRDDLELLFEFVAPGQPATSSVWFAERYWR